MNSSNKIMSFDSIHRLMQQGVQEGIFPGGALIFSKSGRILFNEVYGFANLLERRHVRHATYFDLASLTKPIATTLAIMSLVARRKIELDQPLGQILPAFSHTEKERIQILDLLRHTAGLPAYQPYYLEMQGRDLEERKNILHKRLIQEPLVHPVGETTLYSDIGFMILQWVIETVAEADLDEYIYQHVYDPLDVNGLIFVKSKPYESTSDFAATEICPWRQRLIQGEVHDENAFVMGGIGGHAGLFGTSESVHHLLDVLMGMYLEKQRRAGFQNELVQFFLTPPGSGARALGFDVPSGIGSSCGIYFTKNKTVGHLGFTGTSFWMDLKKAIIIVLLTNRIHPTRGNEAIKSFRPMIHNEIMKTISALFS